MNPGCETDRKWTGPQISDSLSAPGKKFKINKVRCASARPRTRIFSHGIVCACLVRVLVLLLLVPAWAGPAALDNSQASMGSEPTSLAYDVDENCIFDPGPDLPASGGPMEIFGGEHGSDHI